MQWALVIAGIGDFARPAEKLSLTQNAALMCTGAIWTRWCLIIKPRNVLYVFKYFRFLTWRPRLLLLPSTCNTKLIPDSLAAVNFFLGCVGVTQVSRILLHRSNQPDSALEAKKEIADAKAAVAGVAEKAEDKLKS